MIEKVKQNPGILLLGLVLVGLGLRLYSFDAWLFNQDENYTLQTIEQLSWLQILLGKLEPLNPPLYRLFIKAVGMTAGVSEFNLKFPSVLFGVLTLGVVFKIGKVLQGPSLAWVATLLFAFSPIMIVYSQIVRPYTLSVLLTLLSFYFLLVYLKREKAGALWFYFIFNVLSVLTHYLFLFVLVADSLGFLIFRKNLPKGFFPKWICFCLGVGIVLAPLLLAPYHFWAYQYSSIPPLIDFWARPLLAFFSFALGETVYPFFWPAVLPAVVLFGLTFFWGVRYSFVSRENFFVLLRWGIPLLIWLLMVSARPRYVLLSVPFFLLIVAWGILRLPVRSYGKGLIVLLLIFLEGFSIFNWYRRDPEHILEADLLIPWKDIIHHVNQKKSIEEWVLLYPNFDEYLFRYYSVSDDRTHFIAFPEAGYQDSLKAFLSEQKPKGIWLLDLPRNLVFKEFNLGPCYLVKEKIGMLSNPILKEHFETGIKKYRAAVKIYHYQRSGDCEG